MCIYIYICIHTHIHSYISARRRSGDEAPRAPRPASLPGASLPRFILFSFRSFSFSLFFLSFFFSGETQPSTREDSVNDRKIQNHSFAEIFRGLKFRGIPVFPPGSPLEDENPYIYIYMYMCVYIYIYIYI